LSKRSEVASSCWRATEQPLYEKEETKEEEEKKRTTHTGVVALKIQINTHQFESTSQTGLKIPTRS
jgi:hypothetical protein